MSHEKEGETLRIALSEGNAERIKYISLHLLRAACIHPLIGIMSIAPVNYLDIEKIH